MIIIRSCEVQFHRELSIFDRLVPPSMTQDPYIKIFYGGQHRKSSTKHHGGINPRWDEPFLFDLSTNTELRVQVWDRDRFSPDDMVGSGCTDISDLIGVPPGSTKTVHVDLYCHGHVTGRIGMRIEVSGTNEQSQILAQNMSILNATKSNYANQQQQSQPQQQSYYPDKATASTTQPQGFYNANNPANSTATVANQPQKQYAQSMMPQQRAPQPSGIGQRPQQPPTQQSFMPGRTTTQNGFGLRR